MKQTKRFWISLAGSVLFCAAVLLMQASRSRDLADRVAAEREVVAGLEREQRNLEGAVGGSPFLRPLPTAEEMRAKEVAEARAATTPAERVAQTREKLARLVTGVGDLSGSPGEFFRILPDILRVVQDLSVEEMIEVAEGMATEGNDGSDPQTVTRMILLVLAAEQDPGRVMRNDETMKDRQMREMVLGALARRDPDAARRWVENSEMTDREKADFTGVLAYRTLRDDVDAGLKLLRDAKGSGHSSFGPFDSMPLPKEKIPELVAAMRKPENADLREMLETMVITSAMLDGGVKGARAQVEAMELGREELSAFLSRNNRSLMGAQPEEMLEWCREVQTPEEQAKSLPDMVGNWAQQDFNAAGEWLGKLEASPARDAAVRRYVETVVQVDPQAALVWAGTIGAEAERAGATLRAVEWWNRSDQPAAEKWMTDNSVDLETLRARADGTPKTPVRAGSE